MVLVLQERESWGRSDQIDEDTWKVVLLSYQSSQAISPSSNHDVHNDL